MTGDLAKTISYGLKISRVPSKTYERFITLAKEEFSDDYGMLLKYLIDFYVEQQRWLAITEDLLNMLRGEDDESELEGDDKKD